MSYVFSQHAEQKLLLLNARGFLLTREQVIACLESPDTIEPGHEEAKVYQKRLNDAHVLRVVVVDCGLYLRVVTMYPGKRTRYED